MIEYFKLKFRKLQAEVFILESLSNLIIDVKDDENVKMVAKIFELLKTTPSEEWTKVIVEGIKSQEDNV